MSIDYIQRFWDALSQEIERLVGPHSAKALFARLYRLSPNETTILESRIRLPGRDCESTHACQRIEPPGHLTRASEALTVRFDDILSSLIGAALTRTLLYAAMVTANRGFEHSFGSKKDD